MVYPNTKLHIENTRLFEPLDDFFTNIMS